MMTRPNSVRFERRRSAAARQGPPLCRRVAFLAIVLGGVLQGGVQRTNAQTTEIDPSAWKRGYHGYGVLCRSLKLELQNDLSEWSQFLPAETLLIVLGEADELPIDLSSYVQRGGALLVASDREQVFSEFRTRINAGPRHAFDDRDAFFGLRDCPLVYIGGHDAEGNPVRVHDALQGCQTLATNRPGSLDAPRFGTVATLPDVRNRRRGFRVSNQQFIAAYDIQGGGRVLFVADQSLFSNQMIGYYDNAQFALSSLKWLRHGERTQTLIIIDGRVADPMHPQDLQLPLPAPDPADVAAALKSLPPEVLIDFGNTVATTVEDNGVLNGVVERITARFPRRTYQRVLLLVPTALLLLYVLFRLCVARSDEGGRRSRKGKRGRQFFERKQAAVALLQRLRADLTGSSATPWRVVLSRLRVTDRPSQTRKLRRQLGRWATMTRVENPWTSRRLSQLESHVRRWSQLHERGALTYDFDHALVDRGATSG